MTIPLSKRSAAVMGVIVVTALVGSGFYWWLTGNAPDGNGDPKNGNGRIPGKISTEKAQRLIVLKSVGLALLENAEYEKAATAFSEISKALPQQPFGFRNLAITRLLIVEKELGGKNLPQKPARINAAKLAVEKALQKLSNIEKNSAVVSLLRARLNYVLWEKYRGETLHRQSVSAFESAIKKSPKVAHLWYELYKATQYSQDAGMKARSRQALASAYRLDPENIALLLLWLKVQAREKDAQIVNTLTLARKLALPFVDEIKKQNPNYDLDLWMGDGLAAVKKNGPESWGIVSDRVRSWGNVIKNETAAKLDLRRLEPHPLEFVIHDFIPDFYKRAKLPAVRPPVPIPVKFTPAAEKNALPKLTGVRAVKVIDFDLDGKPDVIVLRGRQLEVYRQLTDGWRLLCEITLSFAPSGFFTADLDRDIPRRKKRAPAKNQTSSLKENPNLRENPKAGQVAKRSACLDVDVDLVVYGAGGVVVIRNNLEADSRKRSLKIVRQSDAFGQIRGAITAAVADLDHDNDLDLILSSQAGLSLWFNRGDMTFVDLSARSSLPPTTFKPTALLPVDLDRNVLIDVILADPAGGQAGFLENVRHGRFRFRRFDDKFDRLKRVASLAVADVDGNASWDIVAAGPLGLSVSQSESLPDGSFRFLKSDQWDGSACNNVKCWDFDNDGYQDLLVWKKGKPVVFRGGPRGRFEPVKALFTNLPSDVVASDVADVDGDGDLDLLIAGKESVVWYINEGGNKNSWINVSLRAEETAERREQRCNMYGVGSLLELKVGTLYLARNVAGRVTHFGLGEHKRADVIRALWTNGIPQNILRPDTRLSICSKQDLATGSCPYLYTWTGTKYEFHTDCLWAAPLGLQLADGVLAPTREWEYLRIPGEKLAAVSGEYRLQLTEELWEAAYFDSVKLIAIDHPADVAVYSNEKVAPPQFVQYRIHTVRRPRLPVAAHDQRGRDVLAVIAKRDGQYMQGYDSRLTQGLTKEHHLELDLGKLGSPQSVRLFLTGWIMPTDPSINISLSQNPRLSHPQPPSLWVPDKNGEWKNVIPNMGFPGGKTKTIVVDLSRAFLTTDYRLRIQTTMEIRWDAVFFTVDEEPVECRVTELPVSQAELHYRGFSRRIESAGHGPEHYDYSDVSPHPHWPPMRGRFTRYGDVTPLLRTDDDRLVVLGAGDEMSVSFRVPAQPVPQGWKRDFFLKNVGWDKDCNVNTVYGDTVEPLPFRGMKSYPYPPGVRLPDSPQYQEYLRTYQTRSQPSVRFWKRIHQFLPLNSSTEKSRSP